MDIMQGLNPSQAAAVTHRGGPAIVVAGPGAGKTRVLTARAASLLRDGVPPESILLLTFTRTAAQSMIRKVRSMDERALHITAGTFHSWGIRILNANSAIFGLDRPFTILDQEDASELVKKAMEPLKGQDNWPRASTVAKVISFAANTQLDLAETLRRKAPEYVELEAGIAAVREAYVEMKLDRGLLDYDDVLQYLAILLADEEIGAKIRSQYRHVMLDEVQDNCVLQGRILHGLVGDGGDVMIVGDPSQSIYSFRGASPATMGEFRRLFPAARVIALETNYRSTPEIVSVVNAIDKAMDIGFDRTLRSSKPEGGRRPEILDVADNAAEAAAIADAILADKAEGGEVSDHAVLVRSTASARRIETEFISRGIPHRVLGGTRIDEAAHIRDLLSLGRIVSNLAHEPAWLRLVGRFRRIGDKAAVAIASRTMACPTLAGAVDVLLEEGQSRKTDLNLLANALEAIEQTPRVADGLARAAEIMKPIWAKVWEEDWSTRERDLEAVILIAEEHATLDGFLTAITLDASFDKERPGNEEKPDELPVTISTIHSAKGLEWPHCHVPAFVMGGIPSMFANSPEEREEELRVFYVAASRAERTLTFYRPRFNNQGALTSASTFEPLIRGLVVQRNQPRTITGGASPKIDTSRKIDIRSQLLGSKGK